MTRGDSGGIPGGFHGNIPDEMSREITKRIPEAFPLKSEKVFLEHCEIVAKSFFEFSVLEHLDQRILIQNKKIEKRNFRYNVR